MIEFSNENHIDRKAWSPFNSDRWKRRSRYP